jgi:hypothetical protein
MVLTEQMDRTAQLAQLAQLVLQELMALAEEQQALPARMVLLVQQV